MKYVFAILLVVLVWPISVQAKGDLVTLTNQLRVKQGLQSLVVDTQLTEIARRRAEHIIGSQNFSHEGWKGFYTNQGFCFVGENLARYYKKDSQIMKGWKKSPKHYENLVKPYTHVGLAKVGGVIEGHKTEVVVMTFGIRC